MKSSTNSTNHPKTTKKKPSVYKISVNGRLYKVEVYDESIGAEKRLAVVVNGESYNVEVKEIGGERIALLEAARPTEKIPDKAVPQKEPMVPSISIAKEGIVTAPMPGEIIRVNVKVGDKVKVGDVLLSLEAMKMENEIRSPKTGIVKKVNVSKGMTLESNTVMVVIE